MEPPEHSMRGTYEKLVHKYFKQINVVSGMCCKHMFNLLLFGQILGLKLGLQIIYETASFQNK